MSEKEDPQMVAKARVKNKAPAAIQITAEQLLREASDRLDPTDPSLKIKKYADKQDYEEYLQRNRQFFEDKLRRDRNQMGLWIRYAAFEENQADFKRARSVYERALDVDPYNITLFIKYGEMEMKNQNVNLARNIWDRAVTIQPRVDQFWYKYLLMEERLNNVEGTRSIWERWMQWIPSVAVWHSYIKFEQRQHDWSRVRNIYERLTHHYPKSMDSWLQWAKFEERGMNYARARAVFEKGSDLLYLEGGGEEGHSSCSPSFLIEFAKFEVKRAEIERASSIYRWALEKFPDPKTSPGLHHSWNSFCRQYGGEDEEALLEKRKVQYLRELETEPRDYLKWLDLLRLLIFPKGFGRRGGKKKDGEEEEPSVKEPEISKIREIFQKATSHTPPSLDKDHWRAFVYIWLWWAFWEEAIVGDSSRALGCLTAALAQIPQDHFTFSKLWIAKARICIRRLNVKEARMTFGQAIGKCPTTKIFKTYISLEIALGCFERVRKIYERWIQCDPQNVSIWIEYVQFERALGEVERSRALVKLGIGQPLDMPELFWKAAIDLEIEAEDWEQVSKLYEQLIEQSHGNLKVWISYASWWASTGKSCKHIIDRGLEVVGEPTVLLKAWLEIERLHGDDESVAMVEAKLAGPSQSKFMQMAQKWKSKQQ